MGCTSSAPKMTPLHANAENNLKLSEEQLNENNIERADVEMIADEVDDDKEDDATIVKLVLPKCDTTDETLARNNATLVDAPSLELVEEFHEKYENVQIESELPNSNTTTKENPELKQMSESEHTEFLHSEEKLSTLEEVVEKVVEYYVTDKLETVDRTQKESSNVDKEETSETLNPQISPHKEPVSIPSPSQSSDSRATRWEALADVAAELPPSLTVDPLTGQIYALTK